MKIRSITKSYGRTQILRDISLSASAGECIGILGGNGSGKSTLLNILAGVLRPDGGSFTYNDKELLGNTALRSSVVGYVPQNTPLLDELTAYDNLRLWYTKDEIKKELCAGVLEKLGINEFIKLPVHKMSGGMKKRLSIGCSAAKKPGILLLDEPSAALDLVCKETICDYIKSCKAEGTIVLLATHDIGEFPLCDRIFILKDGVLVPFTYDGDTKKVVSELK